MAEKILSGFQADPVEHIGPDRHHGFRQAGCLIEAHAFRHREEGAFIDSDIFGITAACEQTANLVARFPGVAVGGGHRAGKIDATNHRVFRNNRQGIRDCEAGFGRSARYSGPSFSISTAFIVSPICMTPVLRSRM